MSNITLGFFIKQLAARMQEQAIELPFRDDESWHVLLYALKRKEKEQFPFLASLRFNWDGPYPKSPDFSAFLRGLHWTGSVSALNPSYERIQIPDAVLAAWKHEGADQNARFEELVSEGLSLAKARVSTESLLNA